MEAEWTEGPIHNQRDLCRLRRCSCAGFPRWEPTGKKSRLTGVRASIVAMKPGSAGGAKGCRKVDT